MPQARQVASPIIIHLCSVIPAVLSTQTRKDHLYVYFQNSADEDVQEEEGSSGLVSSSREATGDDNVCVLPKYLMNHYTNCNVM